MPLHFGSLTPTAGANVTLIWAGVQNLQSQLFGVLGMAIFAFAGYGEKVLVKQKLEKNNSIYDTAAWIDRQHFRVLYNLGRGAKSIFFQVKMC